MLTLNKPTDRRRRAILSPAFRRSLPQYETGGAAPLVPLGPVVRLLGWRRRSIPRPKPEAFLKPHHVLWGDRANAKAEGLLTGRVSDP
jgi:hypothetical protein